MESEYDEFIKDFDKKLKKLSNKSFFQILLDSIFSKSVSVEERKIVRDESYEELSKFKFEEYLKQVFDRLLEESPPSRFEYNCKVILSILLNQDITPELKNIFYQHIISFFSSNIKIIQNELQKPNNGLNQTEITSVIMVHIHFLYIYIIIIIN